MQAFESSLKSYLFKAVKNRCLTLINRNEVKQRIEKMIFDNLQSQYDDPDFYAIQELTEKIEEALARLPENVREAFELNRFQNLTYERLGVSPKTIDYRIQQALKQLRIDLKEYLPLLLPFLLH
jgi:RNA polymerase sigma-70 factor (ECF subfamily)